MLNLGHNLENNSESIKEGTERKPFVFTNCSQRPKKYTGNTLEMMLCVKHVLANSAI